MTSDKKVNSNRENSKLGGVKTQDGKDITRFNARKHGILGDLVADYEGDFYRKYLDRLFDELQPTTFIEEMLVERIALLYLKLYRVSKAEAELLHSCMDPTISELDLIVETVREGYKPVVDHSHVKILFEIYARYELSIENRIYRALFELKQIRKSPL